MEVRVTGQYPILVNFTCVDRLQFAPPTPLISFAYGTLYGLAVMNPPMNSIICAGGDDKWLSLYSIVPGNYRLLTRSRTPSPIRCIDFEAKNTFLAVGMAAGVIGVYFLHKQSQKGREDRPFERRTGEDSAVYTFYELAIRKDCLEDISGLHSSSPRRLTSPRY